MQLSRCPCRDPSRLGTAGTLGAGYCEFLSTSDRGGMPRRLSSGRRSSARLRSAYSVSLERVISRTLLPGYLVTTSPLTLHTFSASAPFEFGRRLRVRTTLEWCDGRCVQGPGTYSPRHADPRLLATPASRRRCSLPAIELGPALRIRSASRRRGPLYRPLYAVSIRA